MITTFSNTMMRMYRTHWPSHAVHLTGSPTNIHRRKVTMTVYELYLAIHTFSTAHSQILQVQKALQPSLGHYKLEKWFSPYSPKRRESHCLHSTTALTVLTPA